MQRKASVEAAVSAFADIRHSYEQLADRLRLLLGQLLDASQIARHTIEARAKDVASFREKIMRPGKDYKRPLEEITDLCGLRVIVYHLADVDRVSQLLRREFVVDPMASIDKGATLGADRLGYRSLHLVVRLSDARRVLPEWTSLKELTAEIQIRTVLQHAWAAVSHALQYKNEADVPIRLVRRLNRMSGLLELADEEFQTLRDLSAEVSREVQQRFDAGNLAVLIDANSITTYVSESKLVAQLHTIAERGGFTFAAGGLTNSSSDLVRACKTAELGNIADLEALIKRVKTRYERFVHELKPKAKGWVADDWFLVELAVVLDNNSHFPHETLVKSGWDPSISEQVLGAVAAVNKGIAS